MRIGISRPPSPRFPGIDVDGAAVAVAAEECGFESVFYGEHPVRPLDDPGQGPHADGVPYFQDLTVMLARASALTSTIKLGTAVYLIPEHNPVRAAKELASLDLYSDGRILLGVGIGWSRLEIEVMGGHFDRRWERTAEAIALMRALWSSDRVEFAGEFYRFPALHCYPPPYTPAGPPVLIGAGGDRALRRVAEYGDGWLPAFVTPDQIATAADVVRDAREGLRRYREESGLAPREFDISAIVRGDLDVRETVGRLEDAGADRVIVSLPFVRTVDDARSALERIAALALS